MAIDAKVRCGRYTFRTRILIKCGDVFRSSTGHVGVITGLGKCGTHAEPTAEIVKVVATGKAARDWISSAKVRRHGYNRDIRQEAALLVDELRADADT